MKTNIDRPSKTYECFTKLIVKGVGSRGTLRTLSTSLSPYVVACSSSGVWSGSVRSTRQVRFPSVGIFGLLVAMIQPTSRPGSRCKGQSHTKPTRWSDFARVLTSDRPSIRRTKGWKICRQTMLACCMMTYLQSNDQLLQSKSEKLDLYMESVPLSYVSNYFLPGRRQVYWVVTLRDSYSSIKICSIVCVPWIWCSSPASVICWPIKKMLWVSFWGVSMQAQY